MAPDRAAIAAENSKALLGIFYYKNLYGIIHQNPSRYSAGPTTVACGQPIKVYKDTAKISGKSSEGGGEWMLVKVGLYDGFVMKEDLDEKKPLCGQDLYPKFFDGLDLEITDLYFWGRLYDQYYRGKSRVHQ